MGYAHYFLIQTRVSEQHWAILVARVTRLLRQLPDQVPADPEAKPLRITWEDELLLQKKERESPGDASRG
jgi:hypothetical protein